MRLGGGVNVLLMASITSRKVLKMSLPSRDSQLNLSRHFKIFYQTVIHIVIIVYDYYHVLICILHWIKRNLWRVSHFGSYFPLKVLKQKIWPSTESTFEFSTVIMYCYANLQVCLVQKLVGNFEDLSYIGFIVAISPCHLTFLDVTVCLSLLSWWTRHLKSQQSAAPVLVFLLLIFSFVTHT